MKTGKTLQDLAIELERQNASKKDYVASTLALSYSGKTDTLAIKDIGEFPINDYAHGQIATRLGVPKIYYDRMKSEAPALLETNINHWLWNSPQKQFIRTLDGRVRGVLSDSFRPFDNYDLGQNVLEAAIGAGCEIDSCEITERKLYLKITTPKVTYEIAPGDVVKAGLVISNSEIGAGRLKAEALIFRLVCSNGMIDSGTSFKKNHSGKALVEGLGDNALEFMTDETRRLSDAAIFAQVRDMVSGILSSEGFAKIAERMRASKQDAILKDPFTVMEVFQKRQNLTTDQGKGILAHLIKDGDMSRYGLLNAVTRYSQDVEDYDVATEFERMGGQVLELKPNEWREIAH